MGVWNYWFPYVFKDGLANIPMSITFEVTYRCNLSCLMCPQAIDLQNPESVLQAQMKEDSELKTEEIINVINQASSLGIRRITLTGGEPFVRRDIIDILVAVKRKNMACYIITNGGLMKESYAREIVRMGIDKITLSCDGPEEIHNNIRQNKNQFQDLLKAIRMIQAEKRVQKRNVPDLTLNVTVSSLNAGYMDEIVGIAAREKVNVNFGYLFYASAEMESRTRGIYQATGGKIEDQDVPMSIRTVNVDLLAKEIENAEANASRMGVKINIQPYIKRPEELYGHFFDDSHAYVNHCFYPWYAMRINPYGEVYPCQMNIVIGNVRDKDLRELWNSDAYIRFRQELRNVGIWPRCTKCCKLNNKMWDRLPQMRWYWDNKGKNDSRQY